MNERQLHELLLRDDPKYRDEWERITRPTGRGGLMRFDIFCDVLAVWFLCVAVAWVIVAL